MSDSSSAFDDSDIFFSNLPYQRPEADKHFTFWTYHATSTKAAPVLQRIPAAEAVAGIMSGTLVDRRDAIDVMGPRIDLGAFSGLHSADLLRALRAEDEALQGKTKQLVFIERRSAVDDAEYATTPALRHDLPSARHLSNYVPPATLPGWSMWITFRSKYQSWPGVVEVYTIPPGAQHIPVLPPHAIRFKFPIPMGGKKDFDVFEDAPGAHYSLRLQCERELRAQWLRLRNVRPDEPGLEFLLNQVVMPDVIFVASTGADLLDRETYVDFIFRGLDEEAKQDWTEEVKKIVSHHIPFHFRKRKLDFVASS